MPFPRLINAADDFRERALAASAASDQGNTRAGRHAEALEHAAQALAVGEQTGERWWEAKVHATRGHILLHSGSRNVEAAAASFQTAIRVARKQEARSWELRAATSLARLWAEQGKRRKAHHLLAPLYGWFTEGFDTADLKEAKALSEMLTELGRAVPQIKEPLIDERDQYLASKAVDAGQGKRRVVAVVGAAHVPGMKQHFGAPVDRTALEQLPPPSLLWRAIKWLVPIAFLAAIIWGWQRSETTSFAEMMLAYRQGFESRGLDYAVWGHISDGNVHPNVIPRSYDDVLRGREAILEFGRAVAALGGSPLAEHGVGRSPVKQMLLRELYGEEGIASMRAVKRALDPGWRLAPGVIFPPA